MNVTVSIVLILLLISFALQLYFILEMKRVRIYLESKILLEMQLKERNYRVHKYFMIGLSVAMIFVFTAIGIVILQSLDENNVMQPERLYSGWIFTVNMI